MYKILIADDEPLVQIGLRSMFSSGFDDVEIIGACSNGREALDFMENTLPDIVIADIKMPIMSGLELLAESSKRYGSVPAFIILTAYEEFDLARQALSLQAVDYLVKIELSRDTLRDAVRKAIIRVNEHTSALSRGQDSHSSPIDEYRQKYLLRIFSRMIPDKETLLQQASDLHMNMDYSRFIVVYGQICADNSCSGSDDEKNNNKLITLYSSCADMSKEIISRYAPCYFAVLDMKHFAAIFYFDIEEPVADKNAQIHDALSNVHTMIRNYFNVQVRFGIGTAVTDPMNIATSYEEAKTAQTYTDDSTPVHLFSHIVGANRRSGKDKLISAVQEYIDENLDGHLQLSEIADVFGLSPAYLSVLFKKNADIGFSEYVNSKKIAKAKEMLLSGDMKIYEVADALGFESAYYFSKVFKKVDGHSPREYIQSKSDDVEDED